MCVCGVCVCAEVTEVYDTMSCLPIVSVRAVTKGSKYFELGRQPHKFFNSKYLLYTSCTAFAYPKDYGYIRLIPALTNTKSR